MLLTVLTGVNIGKHWRKIDGKSQKRKVNRFLLRDLPFGCGVIA